MMEQKHFFLKKINKSKNELILQYEKREMNSRKEMIRAGREYYNELFEKYWSNNKETWKGINAIIKK